MRNPRLARWVNLEVTEGLLFFAQRLNESIFDHSLDSYKVPAFNTHTRCEELRATIQDITQGLVSKKNLQPIAEELAESIQKDPAAKTLLGVLAQDAANAAWWEKDNLARADTQCKVVLRHLTYGAYYERLLAELREAVRTPRQKDRIAKLTADLLVEWVHRGFSRQYIFMRAKQAFFWEKGPEITGPEFIDTFLEAFQRDILKFDVCFRVSKHWMLLAEPLRTAKVECSLAAPAPRTEDQYEREFLEKEHVGAFMLFQGIEARDAASARDAAAARMTKLFEIITCHVHRNFPEWDPKALVWWEPAKSRVLTPAKAAILKVADVPSEELLVRLARTVSAHGDPNGASWRRLSAALGLHSSAIIAQDPPVQLSTLWASVETLIPSPPEASIIGGVVETLVPILSHRYVEKILMDLELMLKGCATEVFEAAIEECAPGIRDRRMATARVIALKHSEPARIRLYAALERNPLVKNRLFKVHTALSRADSILDLIEGHRRRVGWQLRRIYRTRNLLLHAGAVSPITQFLVENLHSYFHEVIEVLEKAWSGGSPPFDLDAAMFEIKGEHQLHLARLRSAKAADTNLANVDEFLFGFS